MREARRTTAEPVDRDRETTQWTGSEKAEMAWTEQTREFFKEVQVEFGKISWPSRQELRDSTIVVIFTVLIVSAFVGAVDQLLNLFVHLLFG
jgi:preprotein translocase subunit SecE